MLSAGAKEVDVKKLLEIVGEKAGVTFHIDPAVKGKVSVQFTDMSLQDALGAILGQIDGNNILTGYDREEKAKEIWILPKGTNASTADEDLRLRRFNEEDKKYLKEKYGSLERAICEVLGKIYAKGRWTAVGWNPAFDRPPSLFGGWTLEGDVLGSQESALAFGLSFIKTYESLLQTRTEDLRLNPRLTRSGNGYGFVFDQYLDGVPVEQGIAYISFDSQRLSLANSTFPGVQVSTTPNITPEEATARAIEENEKYYMAENRRYKIKRDLTADEKLRTGDAVLVILPVPILSNHNEPPYNGSPKGYTYHLTYKVPFLAGRYYIDAQTGSLVVRWTDTFKLTATVSGQVYPDRSYVDNAGNLAGSEQASLQNLNVSLNVTPPVHTNSAGQYSYNTTDSVHLGLESAFDGGRDFVIVAEDAHQLDVPWDVNQSGNFTFDADSDNGFRPNAYYWTDKASTWFFNNLATIINVDEVHGTRVRTTVRTNHSFKDGTLGETQGNSRIWFRPAAGSNLAASIFPDIMLHELSHAAAYAKRGSVIATANGMETKGVDESVADYFACRIAGNTEFFSGAGSAGNFNIDPAGSEAPPTEHIGAGIIDERDWQHYWNGSVIASTLWDLTKSVVTDSVLWDSLTSQWLTSYTPEALYDAIFKAATDAKYGKEPNQVGSHLWNTFSTHYMNLWARPNSAGGVLVDWFHHWSPNYQGFYIYRNTTGTFDENSVPVMEGGVPKLLPPETTSWADLSANSSSTTYHYAVRAVTADGQTKSTFSNEAFSKGETYGGSSPAPPRSFYGLVKVIDGDQAVELTWVAGTSTDVSEHVIERADNAGFTENRIEQHVPSAYFQTPDFGCFGVRFGFTQDAKYYYRIKAVDLAGLSSTWVLMNPAYVIPQPNAPAKPTDLKGRGGNGGAKFTWIAPTKNADGSNLTDLAFCRVYFSTNPADPNPAVEETTAESAELVGLTNGTAYFVRVTAVDDVGNESEISETVSVIPMAARWVHFNGQGPEGSYSTISDALSGVSNNTTIIVGPGNYPETQILVGYGKGCGVANCPRNIRLQSERGPENTSIIAGNSGMGFTVQDGSSVIGFTISTGDGIDCNFASDVLIANNIFISNYVSIHSGGNVNDSAGEALRIYNNVFVGNMSYSTSISGIHAYAIVDIENNIFLGKKWSQSTAISQYYSNALIIENNAFFGNDTDIETAGYVPYVSNKYTFLPGFIDYRDEYPLVSDFHLIQHASGINGVNQGSTSLQYKGIDWSRDCDGTPVDLGAYGGPFAYVDNQMPGYPGHGIPDCLEPVGKAGTMVVLKNSVDQSLTLKAQNQMGAASFNVTALPRGTLSGNAPNLAYTVTPDSLDPDALAFTVTNEVGESAPAPIDIRVKETNHPPQAANQTLVLQQGRIGKVLLQGSDQDGDELTYVIDADPDWVICMAPPNCYLMPRIQAEETRSFTYHVNDGTADSVVATVTVVAEHPFHFLEPAEGLTSYTNAPSVALTWLDAPSSSSKITLFAGESTLVADIPESDPTNRYVWEIAALPDGNYPIHALVADEGSVRDERGGTLVIDRQPPQLIIDLAEGLYPLPQIANISVNETATVYCAVDGSEPSSTLPPSAAYRVVADT